MGQAFYASKTQRFDFLKESLGTGDIVLFSGDSFISWFIRCGTASPWSHVGIVIRTLGELYLLHSYPDPLSINYGGSKKGKKKKGVQLNLLRDAIKYYRNHYGRVFIRKRPSTLQDKDPFLEADWKEWFSGAIEKNYESHYWDLGAAQLDFPYCPCCRNHSDSSSYFCSELVREALANLYPKSCGLLVEQEFDEATPKDFSTGITNPCCESKLDLEEWGDEIEVVING